MLKNLLVAGLVLAATSAHAAIVVDGVRDAGYGAPTASVGYNAAAPTSNFGAPTNQDNNVAYDIYLTTSGSNLYGFLQAAGPTSGLDFANLYFDLDPTVTPGSDVGFEITNNRAFVPGNPGYSGPAGIQYALGSNSLEFSIPLIDFAAPIAGLTYFAGQTFPGANDPVTLRLSQSFSYSVAGGASYGVNRLGTFTIPGSVPEPSTWAMMILGFGGIGAVLRRRLAAPAAAVA